MGNPIPEHPALKKSNMSWGGRELKDSPMLNFPCRMMAAEVVFRVNMLAYHGKNETHRRIRVKV
jgi:hypothetical protein